MTSSWFFLSTLNYDARSATHQISKGIVHHEFVPEGQTDTGSFYLSVLERLWKRIRRVRPEYSAPGIWFLLHDNAPVHRAVAVQECLARKYGEPTPPIEPGCNVR